MSEPLWVLLLDRGKDSDVRAISTIKDRIRISGEARYLTIGQIRERFSVSDMWVWRHMRWHGFRKPVQFGGLTSARHWLLTEIGEWEPERAKRRAADSVQP